MKKAPTHYPLQHGTLLKHIHYPLPSCPQPSTVRQCTEGDPQPAAPGNVKKVLHYPICIALRHCTKGFTLLMERWRQKINLHCLFVIKFQATSRLETASFNGNLGLMWKEKNCTPSPLRVLPAKIKRYAGPRTPPPPPACPPP